jgi:DNA-binding MarR family transcriptional regulator
LTLAADHGAGAGAGAGEGAGDPPAAVGDHRAAVTTFAAAFKRATGAVRRLRGRESQHPSELSYAQCGLLFGLADSGQLSASELAGLAAVAPATATQMLDHLEAGGFVERVRSVLDRRIVLISLTPRGAAEVAARRERYEALWARELAGFSIAELEAATAVLERTTAVFVEIAAEPEVA